MLEIHPLQQQWPTQLKHLNLSVAHLEIFHWDLKKPGGLIVTSQRLRADHKDQNKYSTNKT